MDNKISQYIVDLLRRKPEAETMAKWGTVKAAPARTPTPGMLGSGLAQKAAVELLRRKTAPMDYVDSVQ